MRDKSRCMVHNSPRLAIEVVHGLHGVPALVLNGRSGDGARSTTGGGGADEEASAGATGGGATCRNIGERGPATAGRRLADAEKRPEGATDDATDDEASRKADDTGDRDDSRDETGDGNWTWWETLLVNCL